MSREPGTVILDARSRERFNELHIKGAINLPFPDIAIESLEAAIPDPSIGAPGPFPAKIARASLNLSTYIALYSYGYRNIYELAPLVELNASKLEFEAGR